MGNHAMGGDAVGSGFVERLDGRFEGMFRLELVDSLQAKVRDLDGWYLVDPLADLPGATVDGPAAAAHLRAVVEEILTVERGVWTTMIYVQSQAEPEIIKVFHPRRAGCGCGPSQNVKPWWVLTRVPPAPVPAWAEASTLSVCPSPTPTSWWRQLC